MIKSITMMKSRRYNIMGYAITHVLQFISCPTDIVRRAALVFSLMIFAWGSVHAEEIELTELTYPIKSEQSISETAFNDVKAGSYLCVYMADNSSRIYIASKNSYNNLWEGDYGGYFQQSSTYFNQQKRCFIFELTSERLNYITLDEGLRISSDWGDVGISKVTILIPDDFVGTFNGEPILQSIAISRTETNYSFDFSEVLQTYSNVKYARFYLTDGIEQVDLVGDKKITIANGKVTDVSNRGVYVYTGSTLTDDVLKGTLTLPAGEFYNYQLVAVFSTNDPQEQNDGVVTKEPAVLQAKYAVNFTVPVTVIDKYIKWTNDKYNFDVSDLPEQLGATIEEMKNKYSIKWYVLNEKSEKITNISGNNYSDGSWHIYGSSSGQIYPFKQIQNEICLDESSTDWSNNLLDLNDLWNNFSYIVRNPQISCPSNTFESYKDYTVVCEAEIPTAKVKYIFHFTKDGFEPDDFAGDVSEDLTEQRSHGVIAAAEETTLDFSTEFQDVKYARFYLMAADGAMYDSSADAIEVAGGKATDKSKRGKYVYNSGEILTSDNLKIKVKLPAGKFYDYKLVALLSDKTADVDAEGNVTHDAEITKKLVYTFTRAFVFVHSKGASGRDYITSKDDNRIKGTVQQYMWKGDCYDNKIQDGTKFDAIDGTVEEASSDIRQGVHTVEYDVYVDPSSPEQKILYLPFEDYDSGKNGNSLEPYAYIRWYDWETDKNNSSITNIGTDLNELIDADNGESRGWFVLNTGNISKMPTHEKVGVTFNAKDFGEDDCVTIACDVSKYNDGIMGSGDDVYMLHEPTLSTRYIFTIRHAKVIADKIKEGKVKLEAAGADMFELAEDNGRFCVSVKDENTNFSVRANLGRLSYYYIESGSGFEECTHMTWIPYYEDEHGLWKYCGQWAGSKDGTLTGASGKPRIHSFKISSLKGYYEPVGFVADKKEITVTYGSRVHMVGMMNGKEPAVHYEMNFINAPAYWSGNIPDERRAAFLKEKMDLQASLDFDGPFRDSYGSLSTELTSQTENHTYMPFELEEVMYGFCYPQLNKYRTTINGDICGISPIHGDYILLRTMNKDGVSRSETDYIDGRYKWWKGDTELQDYTYRFGGENKGKYGGFLYVDASDEARTIAKLKFKADLCSGSELCYTAVVADMTGGNTKPRLMTSVYAIGADGQRKQVVSFLSCELSSAAEGEYKAGMWYQVYGKIAVPGNIDLSDYEDYEVYIDNYADNTNGADYCVDQIMFYTKNAKVNVYQKAANCDDNSLLLNMYVDRDAIKTLENGTKIFWRICDEDGVPMPASAGLYNNGDKAYGETTIADVPETVPNLNGFTAESGYFVDNSGKMYFSLANKGFALEAGHQYYISVYALGSDPEKAYGDDLWGNSKVKCTIFSPVFYPLRSYLSMHDADGMLQTEVKGDCSTGKAEIDLHAKVNIPDESESTGFKPKGNIAFDFFIGSEEELENYKEGEVTLTSALKDYREKYPEAKNVLNEEYKNSEEVNYNLINKAVTEGKLLLSCSDELICTITNENRNIVAITVKNHIDSETETVYICDYFEFTFKIDATGDGPTMQLGFEDVAYPEDYVRVVRVGREQLLNMQKKDGYLLHVPVNNFNIGSGDDNTGALVIVGNLELLKEGTTDPTISGNNNKVATFAADEEVSAEKMYVSLNFHGEDVTQPEFREGFAYRMFFQVKKKDAGEGACTGNVEFIMKVVPEFVTWNGNAGNTSWNNDGNWTRSKCDELYKHDGQNTPTAAQGDGTDKGEYVDNDATLGQPDTYVPMKFTYVTMPAHNRAPVLAALTKGIDGIYNNVESGATENIQYDIMVRTETVCMDEKHAENGNSSIYDCEKFYGNICKEIYFKPEAELVNQQHLVYERAWVEKELVPAAWYLMSSPLMSVYSGDMYVPRSNGRQETEAFKPIMFNSSYSRTKYPVYQRSWKQEGAKVYTKKLEIVGLDILNETYSANLPYDGVVEETMAQWSHVYNDVAVRDTTLMGFSIRAHKEKQDENALLRLPKEDLTQYFFSWNDGNMDDEGNYFPAMGIRKDPTVHGRFKTDGSDNATLSTGLKGTLKIYYFDSNQDKTIFIDSPDGEQTDLIQVNNGYALIGNPYMSSVSMSKFLEQNSSMIDGTAFWTYEVSDDGTSTELKAHGGSGTIRPVQAFFVKLKDGVSETGEITFTSDMMIDGNTSPETETAAAGVKMMAINSKGQSTAVVAHVDGSSNGYDVGEDVETFFDSNFSDAPTVYTVAGTKAVSVNSLPNIDIVPFGVTCAGNDAVDVIITGTDMITQKLYVYDAANGMCAEIHDGEPISVQPNDYGRYYLTTRSSMNIGESVAQGIMVSVRDGQVTVTAADNIGSVTVTALNGNRVISLTDCGTSATFNLHQGMYLIKTEGDAGKQTVKIMVK